MTNNLKCQICSRDCKNFGSLAMHVMRSHNISVKEYYDRFIKSPNEGICKSCQKQTEFKTLTEGYRTTCCQKCSRHLMSSVESRAKAKQTFMEKYGVENAAELDWVKKKISKEHIQRLSDPKEREKISIATKAAMQRPDVRQKFLNAVRQPKSDETIKKLSASAKQRFINDPTLKNRIYTNERNEKISESKIEFWKNNPEAKLRVGSIWKLWKARDEHGWRKHLLKASQLGFKKIFSDSGETKLERKMYLFLTKNGIKHQRQYELDYKLYDAYLSDYNVLLEFDGNFWHQLSLDTCKYPFQKNSYYNDRHKDEIAKKHGILLFRIREDESPEKILEYIK